MTTQPTPTRTFTRKLQRSLISTAIFLLVCFIAVGGVVAYWFTHTNRNSITTRQTVQNDGNLLKTDAENSISAVVDKVSPSVVSILTSVTKQSMFGVAQGQAAGTGIVISKNGYILTNHHVIDGATTVEVVMSDGTTYDNVQVVGSDPLNDVAYLKVGDVDNLSVASIGDSSTVRVGQQVIAIGNALGQYQNTVSSGIISGKGRPVAAASESGEAAESLTDLLQTDAAINPGNSGGPLLNMSGQVIGMNTAVASNAEGIGFAIPINATKGTTKSVLANKGVQRAYIGVQYVEVTPAVAKQYGLSVSKGAYISASASGSPADRAGLKAKDVITKINNEEIGVAGGVSSIIGEYAPGDTIEVTYLRDKVERTVKVTLSAYQAAS